VRNRARVQGGIEGERVESDRVRVRGTDGVGERKREKKIIYVM
jgi:hypothetical protein